MVARVTFWLGFLFGIACVPLLLVLIAALLIREKDFRDAER